MPGAFAPRFAIEAAFLILLGVGAGYADLRPVVIVALLAGGWVLVALIELAIWRSQAAAVSGTVPAVPEPVEDEAEAEAELPVPSPTEDVYPLRPGAADAPSEEVEEYTRVLSGAPSEEPSPARGQDSR